MAVHVICTVVFFYMCFCARVCPSLPFFFLNLYSILIHYMFKQRQTIKVKTQISQQINNTNKQIDN